MEDDDWCPDWSPTESPPHTPEVRRLTKEKDFSLSVRNLLDGWINDGKEGKDEESVVYYLQKCIEEEEEKRKNKRKKARQNVQKMLNNSKERREKEEQQAAEQKSSTESESVSEEETPGENKSKKKDKSHQDKKRLKRGNKEKKEKAKEGKHKERTHKSSKHGTSDGSSKAEVPSARNRGRPLGHQESAPVLPTRPRPKMHNHNRPFDQEKYNKLYATLSRGDVRQLLQRFEKIAEENHRDAPTPSHRCNNVSSSSSFHQSAQHSPRGQECVQ